MEIFTPCPAHESVAQVRLSEIETNLFRNYEESVEEDSKVTGKAEVKQNRLQSFLRIRPIPSYSSRETSHCLHIPPDEYTDGVTSPADSSIDCKLVAFPPSLSQTFKNTKGQQREIKKRVFEFNRIFDEQTDQQSVYDQGVRPLVDQFVYHNENALLFAYGTTCSGKTHTIRGSPDNPGVIPRAIVHVFESIRGCIHSVPAVKRAKFNDYVRLSAQEIERELNIRQLILNQTNNVETNQWIGSLRSISVPENETTGCLSNTDSNITSTTSNSIMIIDSMVLPNYDNEFIKPAQIPSISISPPPTVFRGTSGHVSSYPLSSLSHNSYVAWVSFVELYNESLIDLLQPDGIKSDRSVAPLKLVRDSNQNFFVSGLRHVFVESAEQAHIVMSYGYANLKKHMSSTGMNLNSSRSHAIFSITLIGLNAYDGVTVQSVSTLSLADLAGTERGKKTGNVGARMKEAGSILKSLFTLKSCISTLRNNQRAANTNIVPYTESALTKLFQPYLGGFGMTSMVIAINPAPEHYDETIGTLDFSAIASKVVVVKEEVRRQIRHNLSRRLTRIWLQSSKNWSSICKNQKKDVSVRGNGPRNVTYDTNTSAMSQLSHALSEYGNVTPEMNSSDLQVLDEDESMEDEQDEEYDEDEEYEEDDDEFERPTSTILRSETSSMYGSEVLDVDLIDDIEVLRELLVEMDEKLNECQQVHVESEMQLKMEHTRAIMEHDHRLHQEFEQKLEIELERQRQLLESKSELIINEYDERVEDYIEKIKKLKDKISVKERHFEEKKQSYRDFVKQVAWRAFDQQIEDTMMDILNRLDERLVLEEAYEQIQAKDALIEKLNQEHLVRSRLVEIDRSGDAVSLKMAPHDSSSKSLKKTMNFNLPLDSSAFTAEVVHTAEETLNSSEQEDNESNEIDSLACKSITLYATKVRPIVAKMKFNEPVRDPGLSTPIARNAWAFDYEDYEDSFEVPSFNSIQSFQLPTSFHQVSDNDYSATSNCGGQKSNSAISVEGIVVNPIAANLMEMTDVKRKQSMTYQTSAAVVSNVMQYSLNKMDDQESNTNGETTGLLQPKLNVITRNKECEARVETIDQETSPIVVRESMQRGKKMMDRSCNTDEIGASREMMQLKALLTIREQSYDDLMLKYKQCSNDLNVLRCEMAKSKKAMIAATNDDLADEQNSQPSITENKDDDLKANSLEPQSPSVLNRLKRNFNLTTEKKQRKRSRGSNLCHQYLQTIRKVIPEEQGNGVECVEASSEVINAKADVNDELGEMLMIAANDVDSKRDRRGQRKTLQSHLKSARKRLTYDQNNSFVLAVRNIS